MRRKENLTLQNGVTMYYMTESQLAVAKKQASKQTTCGAKKDGYGQVPTWEKTAMTPSANSYDLSFQNVDWKKTMFGQ